MLTAVALFAGCSNNTGTENQDAEVQKEEAEVIGINPVVIDVADFTEKAPEMIGERVIIEGSVVHVCKHGGQKMFIMDQDPDVRIKINKDDDMAAFKPEMEGNTVKVMGVVEEMDVEIEEEGVEHEEDEDHENHYHKPQYSIKAMKYTVIEKTPEE